MAMNIKEFHDRAGIEQILGTLTSAKGFPADSLLIPSDAEYQIEFSSGGTTEIVEGNKIVGATSSATAYVCGISLYMGTWAGGDASGILFLRDVSGTFQAENLNVGAGSNLATIPGAPRECKYAGMKPVSAFIMAKTAAVNFTLSGAVPTLAAGTDIGIYLAENISYLIQGFDNVKNFQAINTVNGSGGVLRTILFY